MGPIRSRRETRGSDPGRQGTHRGSVTSPAHALVAFATMGLLSLCPGAELRGEGIESALVDLSLEEILSLEVESVSKRAESYSDVPSSIYVLEREDIARSGATRLSELLQLVPGAWFADTSFDQPTSTVRDFPSTYSGTVLVLLDRVPVQSPLTGAFFYSNFYIDLEQIERIEVIKGSGGSVYGANAATGVISIFTRRASDRSEAIDVDGGSNGFFSSSLSGGRSTGDRQSMRGWIQYFDHDGYARNPSFDGPVVYAYSKDAGADVPVQNRFDIADGDVRSLALGLRHEVAIAAETNLDSHFLYSNSGGKRLALFHEEYPLTPGPTTPDSIFPTDERSLRWTLASRIEHRWRGHETFAQISHRLERAEQAIAGHVEHEVFVTDLELQDRIRLGARNDLDLGVSARRISIRSERKHERTWVFTPRDRLTETLFAGYAQNRTRLSGNLDVVASCKAEIYSLIGNRAEFSPSLRASLRPTGRTTLWAAFSRSLTNPSFQEAEVELWTQQVPPAWAFLAAGVPAEQIPAGAGLWVSLIPNHEPDPAEYWTSEFGARTILGPRTSLELSSFYSRFHGRSMTLTPDMDIVVESPIVDGARVVPFYYTNSTDGWTTGGEAVLRHRWSPGRMLELSHAVLYTHLRLPRSAALPATQTVPEHVVRLRGYQPIPFDCDLTVMAAWSSRTNEVSSFDYVSQKRASEADGGVAVDGGPRLELDVVLQRRFGTDIRLTAWGRNLLQEPYVESFPDFDILLYPRTVERTFGLSLAYGR